MLKARQCTVKTDRNSTKTDEAWRTPRFFWRDEMERLRQLPWTASDEQIMSAASATLKLENQKIMCERMSVSITRQMVMLIIVPSEDWAAASAISGSTRLTRRLFCRHTGKRECAMMSLIKTFDETSSGRRRSWITQAGASRVTVSTPHSYRGGGANALALAGYLDREIQKMGRWRGATVKRVHSRGAVVFFGRDVTQHEEAVSASSLWLEEHTTT